MINDILDIGGSSNYQTIRRVHRDERRFTLIDPSKPPAPPHRHKFDPFVEYYRGKLARPRPPGPPIVIPYCGGGWRLVDTVLGKAYLQDGTELLFPAAAVDRYLAALAAQS